MLSEPPCGPRSAMASIVPASLALLLLPMVRSQDCPLQHQPEPPALPSPSPREPVSLVRPLLLCLPASLPDHSVPLCDFDKGAWPSARPSAD